MLSIDALRETLIAQGIDAQASPSETLGSHHAEPIGAHPSLPPRNDEYEVVRELGRGGMGVVELARQRALQREVAIKRLLNPRHSELLLREARLTGGLEHPNIVPVHAVLSDERGPAVVMKRISGVDWSSKLANGTAMDNAGTLDEHLDTFVQVCRAVAFAHSREVIHRDIKPSNVMIGEFGEVYLVDWGLAVPLSETWPKSLVGTPGYMAPEMIQGDADKRSDVYLLGATLHEVLTGKPRHVGESLLMVLSAAGQSEPHEYEASVPKALGEICNRACALAPQERYPSVDALIGAIRQYREHRVAESFAAVADERVEQLQRAIDTQEPYADVQRMFSEARFAYEQALEQWSDFAEAADARERLLQRMIEHELDLGHPENATALLSALHVSAPELRKRVEQARASRDADRKRFEELERDRDPEVGAAERTRATMGLAGAVTAIVVSFVTLRFVAPQLLAGPWRLLVVGVAVLLVGIAIARHWSARAPMNLINRRIVQVVLGTLVVSLLNRILGVLGGSDTHSVLETDALLLVGGGLALSPFHPAGRWAAGVLAVVAIVGAVWPSWLEPMFIGSAALISLTILVRLRR